MTVLLGEKISDHFTISFDPKARNEKSNTKYVTKMVKTNTDTFVDNLSNIDWSVGVNTINIDQKAEFLAKNTKKCLSQFIKTLSVREDNKEWYNGDLHKQRIERDEAYELAVLTDQQEDWLTAKELQKIYAFNVKDTKNQYIQN